MTHTTTTSSPDSATTCGDAAWERLNATYVDAAEETSAAPPVSAKRRFLRRFLRSRVAVVALLVLLLGAAAAVFAPALAPVDPLAQDLGKVLRPPGGENLLGTDELGRDVLSRLLFGARVSLLAAVEGTAIALLLGVLPGLAAGYLGRRVDRIIMLFTDALMSYPAIILAIAIIGAIGPGLTNAMLAVGIITAPRVVRLVRGVVLGIREETYIEASRTIGTPTARIIVRHVLPNALAPVIVFGSIMAGQAMLIEAGLSFLGLGVQPPDASWGSMLGTAFRYVSRSPTLIVFPGLAIAVTVLAFNVLGDGLRDSLGRENRGER